MELHLVENVTSSWIARASGVKAHQVRKDLWACGIRGTRGRGYDVHELRQQLRELTGLGGEWNVCVVGAGMIGSQLVHDEWYEEIGFPIRAIFDNDPEKTGTPLRHQPILPIEDLGETAQSVDLRIGIICTPPTATQEIADALVEAGVNGIVNFTEVNPVVPNYVVVHQVCALIDLADLASFLSGAPHRAGLPPASVSRIAGYHRMLEFLERHGKRRVTSEELAAGGIDAALVRRDLSCLGAFGQRGRGYEVRNLRERIAEGLGLNREWRTGVVGAGRLGRMIARHEWLGRHGFPVERLFDNDPNRIGEVFAGIRIEPMSEIREAVEHGDLEIVYIATPPTSAQSVAEELVDAGVRAFINFTETNLRLPPDVRVKKAGLFTGLAEIAHKLSRTPA
jgi:redox-sensing transcriptional repressor